MPYKYDAQGALVTSTHNGKVMPVFINAKNEEAPFDADGTVETIARLNGESKTHREAKEAAAALLKPFQDAGLTDAAAAKKALEIVSNLDAKKLVDAGEIEKVKEEVGKAFKTQLDAKDSELKSLQGELYKEKVGGSFQRSVFIKEKLNKALPPDFIEARFGENFGIADGRIYAVDAAGNKIYSRSNPGELAGFDEALSFLVESHPQKDMLLAGTGASGGGAGGGNGGGSGGGGGGKPAGNFGGTKDDRKAAIATRFPELAQSGGGSA